MKLNIDRAAKILVDAEAMGDKKAAEKWEVDERTVRNHRRRLQSVPELASAFNEKSAEAERVWHLVRNRFLRDVTEHLRNLCLKADASQIGDVRQAIKDIGELELAREALGVGVRDHQPRPTASEAPSGETGEADDEEADEGAGA